MIAALIGLPLLGATVLLLGGRRTNAWGHFLAVAMSAASFLLGAFLFIQMVGKSEEEREVDTILKINKLGVWSKGLSKSLKEYDPENYDQEKEMTEKIAQVEKNVRRNANVTNQNVDILLQDAMDDMETDEFINGDEFMMGGQDADDDINGDRDNDDGDGDDNNYAYDD